MSEQSDKDYASRFKKPGEGGASQAPPAQAAPPRPQGLGQLLEDTLVAPLKLGALFSELAPAPAPGFPVLIANTAVYLVSFFAVNLIHVAISNPAALNAAATYRPAAMAVVGLIALAMAVVGSFALAGVLHVLALLSGGQGDFRRTYQIVSLLSFMVPLQAMMNWMPFLWPLPLLMGTYMAVVAFEQLHHASPTKARVVLVAAMILALGAQWFARVQVEKAAERFAAQYRQAAALNQVTRQLEAFSQDALVAPPAQMPATLGASPRARLPAGGSATGSGLDLVGAPAATPEQARALARSAQGMVDNMMPMLKDPGLTKGMTPEQAKQVQDMVQMIGQMQGGLKSGQPPSPQLRDQMIRQMLLMQQSLIQQAQKKGIAAPARKAARSPEDQ